MDQLLTQVISLNWGHNQSVRAREFVRDDLEKGAHGGSGRTQAITVTANDIKRRTRRAEVR
ncbi:protein of unknown function [Methylocaldum szegediense]|uniref:Uncharacterized protein n=1 Tax=Methylocaldum szegediense TaxID=73780 RepID=A0ABN8WYZ7_9GAMM|nr:protein of unknown function [Methylocaldum szegediense]